mmetsp:Transcript_16258/g.47510  ORF Transcript_16258/g.47510 Transcript_16258/m.47510 type:complete len:226 (+) Transcript_16258:427-1104(+)
MPAQCRHLHELVDGRSMPRVHLQQGCNHLRKVMAVVWGDSGVLSPQNLSVETFHVFSTERRAQCNHLVEYTAKRPHVALCIVWHVAPDLWGRIVRCPCLRHAQASFGYLGDIEISELCNHTFWICIEENVCTLQITMKNAHVMQSLQALTHAMEVAPDINLFEGCPLLLILDNLLHQVTPIGTLGHNAEAPGLVIEERLLVSNDVLILHGCQKPNLVQSVLLFLV